MIPADSSRVEGRLVKWVSSRAELDANLADNIHLVLKGNASNPTNYQSGARLNIDRRTNLVLQAVEKGGAEFAFDSYSKNNGIHLTRSSDVRFVGLAFRKSAFYGIRLGSSADFGPVRGANSNVVIEHCTFDDMTQSAIKIDNGDTAESGVTSGVTVRYNSFSNLGQSPSEGLSSFCEAIYMGSGDQFVYINRVNDIEIHHNYFDGSGMPKTSAGEAIEAKVYCSDIHIHHNVIVDWHTGQATSGGAIALAVNAGLNIGDHVVPTSGTCGKESFLIENNRISNTTTVASWMGGNAINLGHGNATIRDNIIEGSQHAAIMIKQKYEPGIQEDYFSNPNEVEVDVVGNTMIDNGTVYAVDAVNPPHQAKIRSVDNRCSNAEDYPTEGIKWLAQRDQWNYINARRRGNR